jgi:two-component system response regulator YesN
LSKLLVCDDEKWIREGICKVIDWASIGIDTILTARDGFSALEIIKKEKPDIVITDIRMPNFSGLELIEAIREIVNPKHIIVISGFSDFEYARTALKLGVSDYLLKPINEDALRQAAGKCLDAVWEEELAGRKLRSAGLDRLNLWLNHSDGEPLNEDIFLSEVGIHAKETSFVIAGICRQSYRGNRGEVLKQVIKSGNYEVGPGDGKYLLFQLHASEYICLFFSSHSSEKQFPADRIFLENIPESDEKNSFIGLGGSVRLEDAWISFGQAETALMYSLIYSKQRIFIYGDLCSRRERSLDVLADFHLSKPVVFLVNHFFGKYKAWVDGIFNSINSNAEKINPKDLIDFFTALVSSIGRIWELEDGELQIFRRGIETAWQQEELYKKLISLPQKLPLERNVGIKRSFLQALDYIEKHYSQHLTMAHTAKALELNASYFSKLFSECAGEPFLKFLTRYRMEKAKILLRESNEKIYEISEKTGYADYRIFSKNFKEYAGVSPSDFRNRIV